MNLKLGAALALLGAVAFGSPCRADGRTFAWDRATLRYAAPGGYARIVRLPDRSLLLSYEDRGRSYIKRSGDEGRTWGNPVLAAEFAFGGAANPQPLVLSDGTLWLFYNERPRDGVHPFTIRLTLSTDGGRTWRPRPQPLYVASPIRGEGCWEPAAVQLKSGEIQLFFANENPYRESNEQEITLLRTTDGGRTWSRPIAVGFRAGHRDGMPVPAQLADGTVAFAIEDNGLTGDGKFKPSIIHSGPAGAWLNVPVTPNDARRWGAVTEPWPEQTYAGAPYLCQLASGATVLSCQSDEGKELSTMAVFVGDADARHFAGKTFPFPVDAGKEGLWNSLFIKQDDTVIAISSTTINHKHGVWLIDGRLK